MKITTYRTGFGTIEVEARLGMGAKVMYKELPNYTEAQKIIDAYRAEYGDERVSVSFVNPSLECPMCGNTLIDIALGNCEGCGLENNEQIKNYVTKHNLKEEPCLDGSVKYCKDGVVKGYGYIDGRKEKQNEHEAAEVLEDLLFDIARDEKYEDLWIRYGDDMRSIINILEHS